MSDKIPTARQIRIIHTHNTGLSLCTVFVVFTICAVCAIFVIFCFGLNLVDGEPRAEDTLPRVVKHLEGPILAPLVSPMCLLEALGKCINDDLIQPRHAEHHEQDVLAHVV